MMSENKTCDCTGREVCGTCWPDEQDGEPIAWVSTEILEGHCSGAMALKEKPDVVYDIMPLFIRPAKKLTEKEIMSVVKNLGYIIKSNLQTEEFLVFARAIESKIRGEE